MSGGVGGRIGAEGGNLRMGRPPRVGLRSVEEGVFSGPGSQSKREDETGRDSQVVHKVVQGRD